MEKIVWKSFQGQYAITNFGRVAIKCEGGYQITESPKIVAKVISMRESDETERAIERARFNKKGE